MSFNIDTFKAVTLGSNRYFSKPNKFLARIPLPTGLANKQEFRNTQQELEFWCHTASLPGAALITRDVQRYSYGAREKRPMAPMFQDLNFVFFADTGRNGYPNVSTNWNFFTSWVRLINNFDMSQGYMDDSGANARSIGSGDAYEQDTYELAYKTEYLVDIELVAFADDGNESHHIILRDAFPTYVQEIRTSWADNSGVMNIPVLMTFTDWFLQDTPL